MHWCFILSSIGYIFYMGKGRWKFVTILNDRSLYCIKDIQVNFSRCVCTSELIPCKSLIFSLFSSQWRGNTKMYGWCVITHWDLEWWHREGSISTPIIGRTPLLISHPRQWKVIYRSSIPLQLDLFSIYCCSFAGIHTTLWNLEFYFAINFALPLFKWLYSYR